MAYGKECPICGAVVDNNEFDYRRGICNDCSENVDIEIVRQANIAKMLKSECEQMVLEV